jgi:hypothetical protein
MPDLNLAGSAVRAYMFEPTKGIGGDKSESGSEEYADSDDEVEMSHESYVNESYEDEETEHVCQW